MFSYYTPNILTTWDYMYSNKTIYRNMSTISFRSFEKKVIGDLKHWTTAALPYACSKL